MISRDDVRYIAELARLELGEAEIDELRGHLGSIIGYMEQLKAVDTEGIEPTCLAAAPQGVQREDAQGPSLPVEEALRNGPVARGGFFAVPKVIEQQA